MSQTLLAGEISWCWNDWKYPIGFYDLSVSEWVPKLAIFSGSYLRVYLSYIIEIWYSLQDGLNNYMCIISALYLKWVPSSKLARNGSCTACTAKPMLELGLRTLCTLIYIYIYIPIIYLNFICLFFIPIYLFSFSKCEYSILTFDMF